MTARDLGVVMHFLFLDESGEFGFQDGSSKHLLLAILETDDPKRLKNVIRKEKKALHDLGWPRNLEIKGTSLWKCSRNKAVPKVISQNRDAHLSRIVERILSCGARPHYFVVRKSALKESLKKAPYGIAYNYFAGNILCKIHAKKFQFPVTLVVDRRNKETHANMPFNDYITTRMITDCDHEHGFSIRHEESHEWLGLQAVDFIAWGLFRFYEHGDSTFKNLIAPNVGIREAWYV